MDLGALRPPLPLYTAKEIYYTLQGEGARAGRAAVFLRFAGCNLWSGLERDRDRGPGSCAAWCDTDFVGTDGPGGGRFETARELADRVAATWPIPETAPSGAPPAAHGARVERSVVCTGGEPLLQLDEALVTELRTRGFRVAVETNGSRPVPAGVGWICVSPKAGVPLVQRSGDELKFVFPQPGLEPEEFESLDFAEFVLQPMDGPDLAANTRAAAERCLKNPRWRLGLQIHKIAGLP